MQATNYLAMTNERANDLSVEKIKMFSPYQAANFLNILTGNVDYWTIDEAKTLLFVDHWANGEKIADNERAALEIIAAMNSHDDLMHAVQAASDTLHIFKGNQNPVCIENAIKILTTAYAKAERGE
jgi:hypothetical protein